VDRLSSKLRIGEKIGLSFGLVGLLFLGVIWHYHASLKQVLSGYERLHDIYETRKSRALEIEIQLRRPLTHATSPQVDGLDHAQGDPAHVGTVAKAPVQSRVQPGCQLDRIAYKPVPPVEVGSHVEGLQASPGARQGDPGSDDMTRLAFGSEGPREFGSQLDVGKADPPGGRFGPLGPPVGYRSMRQIRQLTVPARHLQPENPAESERETYLRFRQEANGSA